MSSINFVNRNGQPAKGRVISNSNLVAVQVRQINGANLFHSEKITNGGPGSGPHADYYGNFEDFKEQHKKIYPAATDDEIKSAHANYQSKIGPHKVGDMVKLTKPGFNGPVNIAGRVTRHMPEGRIEVRTQQDGYHVIHHSDASKISNSQVTAHPPQGVQPFSEDAEAIKQALKDNTIKEGVEREEEQLAEASGVTSRNVDDETLAKKDRIDNDDMGDEGDDEMVSNGKKNHSVIASKASSRARLMSFNVRKHPSGKGHRDAHAAHIDATAKHETAASSASTEPEKRSFHKVQAIVHGKNAQYHESQSHYFSNSDAYKDIIANAKKVAEKKGKDGDRITKKEKTPKEDKKADAKTDDWKPFVKGMRKPETVSNEADTLTLKAKRSDNKDDHLKAYKAHHKAFAAVHDTKTAKYHAGMAEEHYNAFMGKKPDNKVSNSENIGQSKWASEHADKTTTLASQIGGNITKDNMAAVDAHEAAAKANDDHANTDIGDFQKEYHKNKAEYHRNMAKRHKDVATGKQTVDGITVNSRQTYADIISNIGTSAGVKKEWETRRGEFGGEYNHDDARGVLQTAKSEHLSKVVKGEHDIHELARHEAASRGLDKNGKFVGFHAARIAHKAIIPSPTNKNPDDNIRGNMQLMKDSTILKAANGNLDLKTMAKKELASRGQDENGKWVGFQKAKQIHGTSYSNSKTNYTDIVSNIRSSREVFTNSEIIVIDPDNLTDQERDAIYSKASEYVDSGETMPPFLEALVDQVTGQDFGDAPDDTLNNSAAGEGGFLVSKNGQGHLPTRKNGKIDRGLLGSAHAALHGGFRGNKYEGPDKTLAIGKLKRLYKSQKMDWPGDN